ncbi:MAG: hypothetical protein HPY58_02995 [Firmicutes bacterium]|nr:hypothetical protein [Bacillota bacterium]
MGTELIGMILAVIALDPGLVAGGAPVFVARSREEQERMALVLSRILKGMVHDLENGLLIIVKH